MSIRKRSWINSKGQRSSAWVVDYIDLNRKRRLKTFNNKPDAAAFYKVASVKPKIAPHSAIEKIKEDLSYRTPNLGKPLGHVVLTRQQAESLVLAWLTDRR